MTNITDLAFDDGAQLNVEVELNTGSLYTYAASSIDLTYNAAGVMAQYSQEAGDFKVFLPWSRVTQIWQEV